MSKLCYLNYLYILFITVDELMNCIDHCFTPTHAYFVYLIKTNLTFLMEKKLVDWWDSFSPDNLRGKVLLGYAGLLSSIELRHLSLLLTVIYLLYSMHLRVKRG